jgi:hypothetical protein
VPSGRPGSALTSPNTALFETHGGFVVRAIAIAGLGIMLCVLPCVPASAASMCVTDGAASPKLHEATSKASAKFLDAASRALLMFRALDLGEDFKRHASEARSLLDDALAGYQAALALKDELRSADQFLRERHFENLQRSLGITPGTLDHVRWEALVRIARQSKTPAAELIGVCITSIAQLKYATESVRADMHRALLRRAAATWYAVLSHGALVSDAFDASLH